MIYPTINWISSTLRRSLYAARRVTILEAFIVGSVAKGTDNADSDLDIAIIIPPVKGKTSLKYTEEYHHKFLDEKHYPVWEGKRVDFQFFYSDDPEWKEYTKIPLTRPIPSPKAARYCTGKTVLN